MGVTAIKRIENRSSEWVTEVNADTALWDTETHGIAPGVCVMQGDGNLVVYDGGGAAVWDSGTWDSPGAALFVQDDGNVVIYRPEGHPLWATGTNR